MKMVEALKSRPPASVQHSDDSSNPSGELPPLRHLGANWTDFNSDSEGWTKSQTPALFLFAGQGPYVSRSASFAQQRRTNAPLLMHLIRDYMPFAVSLPDDGLIDLVLQEMVSASVNAVLIKLNPFRILRVQTGTKMLLNGGMVDGKVFWHPKVSKITT